MMRTWQPSRAATGSTNGWRSFPRKCLAPSELSVMSDESRPAGTRSLSTRHSALITSFDTIVAPATPVGRGALAIVRLDGPRSADILTALSGMTPERRIATLTQLHTLDECVVVRYA